VQPGNSINLTYTDTATNTQHQVTILRVDDPAALPLSNTATANPNDQVIGVNFTGGMGVDRGAVEHRARAAHLQFSNPSGSTLRVVDDNTSAAVVNAASTNDDRLVAGGRHSAAAVVHRRGCPLYRQDHGQRLTDDRPCRTHQRQSGAARRSVEVTVTYVAADAVGDTTRADLFIRN